MIIIEKGSSYLFSKAVDFNFLVLQIIQIITLQRVLHITWHISYNLHIFLFSSGEMPVSIVQVHISADLMEIHTSWIRKNIFKAGLQCRTLATNWEPGTIFISKTSQCLKQTHFLSVWAAFKHMCVPERVWLFEMYLCSNFETELLGMKLFPAS